MITVFSISDLKQQTTNYKTTIHKTTCLATVIQKYNVQHKLECYETNDISLASAVQSAAHSL